MNIKELHDFALEKADLAFIEKRNNRESLELFKEAFNFEKQAALKSKEEKIGEPSESILLRSAATLAIKCNEFREAEKLISLALAGEPPFEIAEELRNLLEDVNFQRHLGAKGIILDSSELQLAISGNSVGYGFAKPEQVFERLRTIEQMTYRTLERKANKPFRTKGNFPKSIKMSYEPYLSVPRAACMAFTIRIGKNTNQENLFGKNYTDEIIDDLFENLGLINKGDLDSLKLNIPDNDYYENYIARSKELAPDGEEIKMVGLTIFRDGTKKDIALTKPRKEFKTLGIDQNIDLKKDISELKYIELEGRFYYADEEKNKIKLTTSIDNKQYDITVSDGLIDIVKRYFGESVKVIAMTEKGRTKLIGIDPV